MKNFLVKQLVAASRRPHSFAYQTISMALGVIIFAIFLPTLFIFLGKILERFFMISWPTPITFLIVIISLPIGLFFIIWAIGTQYIMGLGTPAHNAPTKKLVIAGPYKLCRNPMQLGGMLWYLGLGTFFASPTTGIFCALCELTLGTLYHKLIEEKELEQRFGIAYIHYKKHTPFLIPRIRSR